jgi:hypothetical protein
MQDVRPRATPPTKATPPPATKLMGRFQCEALLHGEGLLETWRARVHGLAGFDRVFAVKCLVPGALTRRPRAAEDLLRNARAAAAIKDERLASVMDSGLAPGSAFVATEFIHGISLRALREYVHGRAAEEGGRPTSWPAVIIHICAEIACALAAAHAAAPALPHGALAAGSVMVTPQGGIKLVDLGLFSSVHTPAEVAASPVRRGCAAPELSRGQPPSPASDMYALGALALELATGRERRASGTLDSGTSWSRVLAAELQTLVRRLLSFEPAERPTAEQAAAALLEAAALVRGIDLRGELGQLVRRVLQSNGGEPAQSAEPQAAAADAPEGPPEADGLPAELEMTDQPFVDEPTQVLEIQADGNPDQLAGILRGLRQEAEQEEGTVIDGRRSRNTPVFATPAAGTPIVQSGADEAAPVAWTGSHAAVTQAAEAEAETRVQGVPAGALPEVSSAEITQALGSAGAALLEPPAAAGPRPAVVPFEEFAPEVPAPSQMTPSGWHPAGDLDGPTETDHRPLADEGAAAPASPEGVRATRRPQRRMGGLSRTLLVLVAAVVFGAGLAAAVRFVAGKPPATVPDGYSPRPGS